LRLTVVIIIKIGISQSKREFRRVADVNVIGLLVSGRTDIPRKTS